MGWSTSTNAYVHTIMEDVAMSDITLPAGWSLYRTNGDEVTWKHSTHTSAVPVLWIMKAKPPVKGVLNYLHRLVIGKKTSGSTETRNTIIDLSSRSVPDQDQSAVASRLVEMLIAISTTGGIDDLTITGDLPQ